MKNVKKTLALLYTLSFALSVSPVCAYVLVNREKYIKTLSDGVKLGAGAVICVVILIIKAAGKLKINSRFTFFALTGVICYLLMPVISDICTLCLLALVGESLDFAVSVPIKRIKEKAKLDAVCGETSRRVEEIVSRYYRGA